MSAQPYKIRLERTQDLSPSVREFHFVVVGVERFEFRAGQWVSILMPIDGPDRKRAYSIASPPCGDNRFALAVTHVTRGPGSSYLFGLVAGAELEMVGPQGFFAIKDQATRPQVFVATGTGITPLRSMLRVLLAEGTKQRVTLIFGVRNEAEILFRGEFERLARDHTNFVFVPTLSQPSADWTGACGYVQLRIRERLVAEKDSVIYVCGLKKMVNDVRAILRNELGFAKGQVITERYD